MAEMYEAPEIARRVMKERLRIAHPIVAPSMRRAIAQKCSGDDDRMLVLEYILKFLPQEDPERRILIGLSIISESELDSILKYRQECGAAAYHVGSPIHSHYQWVSEGYTDNYGWFDDLKGRHVDCNQGGSYWFHEADKNARLSSRAWWRDYVLSVATEVRINLDLSIVTGGFFDTALRLGSLSPVCKGDGWKRDLKKQLTRFCGCLGGRNGCGYS